MKYTVIKHGAKYTLGLTPEDIIRIECPECKNKIHEADIKLVGETIDRTIEITCIVCGCIFKAEKEKQKWRKFAWQAQLVTHRYGDQRIQEQRGRW